MVDSSVSKHMVLDFEFTSKQSFDNNSTAIFPINS
jgi:hypothetical protein